MAIVMNKLSHALLLFVMLAAPAIAQENATNSIPKNVPNQNASQYVDPSKNVLDLVEAAIRRQDDLRAVNAKLVQTQLDSSEKLNELRYRQTQELAAALANKLAGEATLRSEYTERLAIAEAKRIDAIRAVDVNAVAVANQRTSEQATALQTQTSASAEVLRNQVARSAEDLRALVATTAATALQNQQQQFTGLASQIASLSTRITTLEQSGAEGKGKQTFQDPVIADLLREVRALSASRTSVTGVDQGRGEMVAWVLAGLMFLIALGGFVFNLFRQSQRR